jgi:hypothetical protein
MYSITNLIKLKYNLKKIIKMLCEKGRIRSGLDECTPQCADPLPSSFTCSEDR